MKIISAEPRGFCAGVKHAVEILKKTFSEHPGEPLYLLHEIVHNETVSEYSRQNGAVIVENMEQIPPGGRLLISAHGAAKEIFETAKQRNLQIVDATCPLVRQVQCRAEKLISAGKTVLLFGHPRHREVIGILGHCQAGKCIVLDSLAAVENFQPASGERYAVLSQTTWNADDVRIMTELLQKKIPDIELSGTVCTATAERQKAVRELAGKCDAVFIVGSSTSSNTMRLFEIARLSCPKTYLLKNVSELKKEMLSGIDTLGIASGASTAEDDIREIIDAVNAF